MQVMGLNLPLVETGDDLISMILKAADQIGGLHNGDVVVVSSKVVAAAEGRFRDLSKIRPSARAKKIAANSGQAPEFVELVLNEADRVLRVCKGAILTIKDGLTCANAGADLSNAPEGKAILLPASPDKAADKIRRALATRARVKIAVVISDSVVHPLKLGTVGQAIATAGMEPVIDCRGKLDLYGKPLKITFRAVADQLATAAGAVMGEGGERVPVVVVRNADVKFVEKHRLSPKISPKKCAYFGGLKL
ncbi:MAG: coenzyme F420-0:L-glutamate ligase [Methanobacteriota archaeon]